MKKIVAALASVSLLAAPLALGPTPAMAQHSHGGTGGHSFAATLEQHEKNVERWRGIEHQRTLAPAEPAPRRGALRGEMPNGH